MISFEDGYKRRLLFNRSGSSLRIIEDAGRSLIFLTSKQIREQVFFGLREGPICPEFCRNYRVVICCLVKARARFSDQ
jgi:hypothetical protein